MGQRVTEKTLRTGAIDINYAEGPDKGPSIVLLHGGSANWHDLEDLGNVFSGH